VNDIETWIAEYVRREGRGGAVPEDELLDVNYVDRELLDSLAIVSLIIGIEDEFGVRLEPAHMQDPRFCTVRGLGAIVSEARP
jgi:acyl carrier protein